MWKQMATTPPTQPMEMSSESHHTDEKQRTFSSRSESVGPGLSTRLLF